MTYRYIYRSIIITAFLAAFAFAGDIMLSVSHDSVTVGDVISLRVKLGVPKGVRVVPPETEGGFGDFRVLHWDKNDDSLVYRYEIATYKPQSCTIPELRFMIGGEEAAVYDTLATPAVPVRVVSVIPEDTPDSAVAIRDLKAQQRMGGIDLRTLWILLAAALVIAGYLLWEKYVKKKAGGSAPVIPLKPPYEEAMEAIAELEAKKYPERGNVREHVFELSEIFKRYIGRRYNTIASELTTEELVARLEYSTLSREMRMSAEWFFRTGDQVKFAKWLPDSQTLHRFMKEVRTFLEATKPDSELQYEKATIRMGALE